MMTLLTLFLLDNTRGAKWVTYAELALAGTLAGFGLSAGNIWLVLLPLVATFVDAVVSLSIGLSDWQARRELARMGYPPPRRTR